MNKIKDCDASSARGKRTVEKGLNSAAGKALLKGFEMNSRKGAGTPLLKALKAQGGAILITSLKPGKHLDPPAGATHVCLTGLVTGLNLNGMEHRVYESSTTLALNQPVFSGSLSAANSLPPGQVLYLLQVAYLQEVNGQLYPLQDKSHNSMTVVEVI
jgi:hypothetical protein